MIVADENLHGFLIQTLRESGFDVTSVAAVSFGITDEEVIQLSLLNHAILITEDKDFGELIFAHDISRVTVVFLRYRKPELAKIAQNLVNVVQEYTVKKGRFFIVVTSTRIRVRSI
jgi:predicted nuclease of predicted toxin-antitoxin system